MMLKFYLPILAKQIEERGLMKMRKLFALFVVTMLLVGVFPVVKAVDLPTEVKITVEQIFGIMPDDYIGSFGLGGPNTVENGYSIGYYYPMCGMKAVGDKLYIADTAYGRIHILDSSFEQIKVFGSLGIGDGQFQYPVDINTDKAGNVYIADMFNCNIQKFDSSGKFLDKFGSEGQDNGQFIAPGGLAIDNDGNIYVSDGDSARIQKFDSNFKYVLNFTYADGNPVESPGPIRIAPNGNILVAEMKAGRIYEFTPDGKFVRPFVNVKPDDPLKKLGAFDFDNSGNLIVIDRAPGNCNVRVYTSDGKEKDKYQCVTSEDMSDGLAVGSDGIYVHIYGRTFPGSGAALDNPFIGPSIQKLMKLDFSGKTKDEKQFDPSADGRGGHMSSCAVASDGTVYGVSSVVFDSQGKFSSKVFVWSSDGTLEETILPSTLGIPDSHVIRSIAINSYDDVFIGVTESLRSENKGYIIKLATKEKFGDGEIGNPMGITIDKMDNIYVADHGNQSILIYTNKGKKRDELSISAAPSSISVDPFRNIACSTDASIVVVDKKGRDLGTMGSQGRRSGQVYYPQGCIFSSTGGVIVSDTENGRIQIFERKEGSDFQISYTSPRQFYVSSGLAWGKDKKLYICDSFHNVVYKVAVAGHEPPGFGESGPEPPLPPPPPAPQTIPSDGEIMFTPLDLKVQNGATLDCNINIKYASNVYGVGMTLKYDSNFLKMEKCEQGDFLSNDGNKNLFIFKEDPKGNVRIGGPTRTGPVTGVNGEGALIKIRFSALKEGETTLDLSDVMVKDQELNNVQVSVKTGKVKISPKDSTPPPVTLTNPKTCVWEASYAISGTTEKDARLVLKFGDKQTEIKNNNGTFITSLTLNKGDNTIIITATDPAGNSKDYSFAIKYAMRNTIIMWVGKTAYMVNGEPKNFTVPPQPVGGSTYVPLRDLGNALGCTTEYFAAEKKVIYTYNNLCSGSKIVLELWINKKDGKRNGAPFDFVKAPLIVGGKTLVPLRAISEGLDASVTYENATKQITIIHPKP